MANGGIMPASKHHLANAFRLRRPQGKKYTRTANEDRINRIACREDHITSQLVLPEKLRRARRQIGQQNLVSAPQAIEPWIKIERRN